MKNIIVYLDPSTGELVAKAMASSHIAYEAMRRAGKKNIKALYCAPCDVERTKDAVMALAQKAAIEHAEEFYTVDVQFDGCARIYTYLASKRYNVGQTVFVPTSEGNKQVTVVRSIIRNKQELEKKCPFDNYKFVIWHPESDA